MIQKGILLNTSTSSRLFKFLSLIEQGLITYPAAAGYPYFAGNTKLYLRIVTL
jgi:hypothetical protein